MAEFEVTQERSLQISLQGGSGDSQLQGKSLRLEARVGIEPTHKGFADLSLTTWVPRPSLLEDPNGRTCVFCLEFPERSGSVEGSPKTIEPQRCRRKQREKSLPWRLCGREIKRFSGAG